MEATTFDTKPLLRPHQVENHENEIKVLETQLTNPAVQDKGEVRKRLLRTRQQLEQQRPRAPETPEEEGRMHKRADELLSEIVPSMCSQEEMRKNPTGSVDKYQNGEASSWMKKKILEWKNLMLRLKPGEREAANLERHRPKVSTLNLDNAQIPGKAFYIPPNVGASITFSEEEIASLRALRPSLADSLGLMSNEQRLIMKDLLAGLSEPAAKPTKGGSARERLSA